MTRDLTIRGKKETAHLGPPVQGTLSWGQPGTTEDFKWSEIIRRQEESVA